jgi:hypothetical protein
MVPLPDRQEPQPSSPVTWEPIPVGGAPPKPNTIEEATATHPRLQLGADANWKVQLMSPFHNGENWWGSTVGVAVIVVLLHPYSSTITIFSTHIVWLLCDSVVEAT